MSLVNKGKRKSPMSGISQTKQNQLETHMDGLLVVCPEFEKVAGFLLFHIME